MHNQRQTQGHNHNRKRNIMEEAQSFCCRLILVFPIEEGRGLCECLLLQKKLPKLSEFVEGGRG
jgi:hypothetical protein